MTACRTSKIISSVVCALFLASLLTACGEKKPATATATPTPANTTATTKAIVATATATPVAGPTEVPAVDMKGKIIRVFSEFGDQSFSGGGKVGTAVDVMSTKTEEAKAMKKRIQDVQKKYNCVIKFAGQQTGTFWDKVLESGLSGAPVADFGYVGLENIYKAISQAGGYQPLNKYADILDVENPDLWAVNLDKAAFTYNGMIMGLQQRSKGFDAVNGGYVMYFNKSLMLRENLWKEYNLYDMQQKKTWNWNTFSTLCSKVSKDKDGDGVNDQIGINYSEYLLRALMHTNVADPNQGGWIVIDSKGAAKVAIADKQHRPALELLVSMKKKGSLSNDNTAGGGTTVAAMSLFQAGKELFLCDYGNRINVLKQAKMADTWGVVALPLSPTGNKNYVLPVSGYFPYVMASGVKDPKMVAYIFRALAPPAEISAEAEQVAAEAQLGQYIGSESRVVETYQLLSNPDCVSPDLDTMFLGCVGIQMWIFLANMGFAVDGTLTIEQLIQATLPKFQSSVNDFWLRVQSGAKKLKKNSGL